MNHQLRFVSKASGVLFSLIYLSGCSSSLSIVASTNNASNPSTPAVPAVPVTFNGVFKSATSFGGSNNERGDSVMMDASGNVFLTGRFNSPSINLGGSTLTNAGGQDVLVSKHNSSGVHQWSISAGSPGSEEGVELAVNTHGDVLVTGIFNAAGLDFGGGALAFSGGDRDGYVVKLSGSTGSQVWAKRYGNTGDNFFRAITTDRNNNVIVAGSFNNSELNFGGGALTHAGVEDAFVAKLDNSGNTLWSKGFGSLGSDMVQGVATDSRGDVYVVVVCTNGINFTGHVGDSGYDASKALSGDGSTDTCVAKLDGSNGAHLWSFLIGSAGADEGRAIKVDSEDNLIITGHFTGSASLNLGGGLRTVATPGRDEIFLAKYAGATGAHLWSKVFGSTGDDMAIEVAVNSDNTVAMTGHISGTVNLGGSDLTSAGGQDIFTAVYKSDGTHLYSAAWGGTANDRGRAIYWDPINGDLVATGLIGNAATFGGSALAFAGGAEDIFRLRLGK